MACFASNHINPDLIKLWAFFENETKYISQVTVVDQLDFCKQSRDIE